MEYRLTSNLMETNSQEGKPDFTQIAKDHYNRVGERADEREYLIEIFAYKKGYQDCWYSLQSELSSLREELKQKSEWLEAYKESNARLVAKLGNYACRIDDVSKELKSRIEELSKDKTS